MDLSISGNSFARLTSPESSTPTSTPDFLDKSVNHETPAPKGRKLVWDSPTTSIIHHNRAEATQASTALTPYWNSPTQTGVVSEHTQQINLDWAAHIVEIRQGISSSSTIQRILDRGLSSRQGSLDWNNTYLRRTGKTLKEYYMLTPTQPKRRGTILYNGNTAYHFSRISPASSLPFRPIYKILSQTRSHDWISIGHEDFELLEPLVPTAKHLAALSTFTQQ